MNKINMHYVLEISYFLGLPKIAEMKNSAV